MSALVGMSLGSRTSSAGSAGAGVPKRSGNPCFVRRIWRTTHRRSSTSRTVPNAGYLCHRTDPSGGHGVYWTWPPLDFASGSTEMPEAREYPPCLRALRRTAARPAGVRGPVDFNALRRFAAICFWVAMGKTFLCTFRETKQPGHSYTPPLCRKGRSELDPVSGGREAAHPGTGQHPEDKPAAAR